jgi:D-amino peptidase
MLRKGRQLEHLKKFCNRGETCMKILIATDMEGITGVTTWDQVTPGHAEYARFRKLMTQDVNAAMRGASDAGADEIIVADGHWNGSNILIEELDSRARLNTGSPSPFSMMQGIDESVDGVIFIGYHARNGSPSAILDHTWSSKTVANVWLNDILTGEYGLNAAVAGHFGVPVIMVSGDQTACAQVTELLGEMETSIVKQASGRFAAECLAPQSTQEIIRLSAERAVTRLAEGDIPDPFILELPITVTVEFFTSDMADRATRIPFTKRDGTRVSFTAEEMASAYNGFRAMVMLALG